MSIDRRSRRRVTLIAVLFLVLAGTDASADTVRVTVDRALVWTRPTGVSVVITQLPRGVVVEVVRRVDDWYEIVLPAQGGAVNRTGFIRVAQTAIQSLGPPSPALARLLAARSALSRPRSPIYLNIDAGYRWNDGDVKRSSAAFTETYAEAGRIDANYGSNAGWSFDALVGQAIWGEFGIGLGGGYYRREQPVTADAQVPHPFFFNQPRSVSFETPPLAGSEWALHVPILWIPPPRGRLNIMIFGGPSLFYLSQSTVTSLSLNDAYPYDTVGVDRAITTERTAIGAGFHVGTDISYFFSRSVGLGIGARYATAFDLQDDDAAKTSGFAGSAQALAGLRFRF